MDSWYRQHVTSSESTLNVDESNFISRTNLLTISNICSNILFKYFVFFYPPLFFLFARFHVNSIHVRTSYLQNCTLIYYKFNEKCFLKHFICTKNKSSWFNKIFSSIYCQINFLIRITKFLLSLIFICLFLYEIL